MIPVLKFNNQPERTMNECNDPDHGAINAERSESRGLRKAWIELDDKRQQLESELTAVTEQRDGLRSGIDYASDQLHKVTEQRDRLQKIVDEQCRVSSVCREYREQRDRLAEVLRNIMAYRKGEKPHDYWRLPFEERENAAFDAWIQIENSINQALQSLTTNAIAQTPPDSGTKNHG